MTTGPLGDPAGRRAETLTGVGGARAGQRAARPRRHQARLRFAPDPASQLAETLGGNVATNAGDIHVPIYGAISQHVLAVEPRDAEGWSPATRAVPCRSPEPAGRSSTRPSCSHGRWPLGRPAH